MNEAGTRPPAPSRSLPPRRAAASPGTPGPERPGPGVPPAQGAAPARGHGQGHWPTRPEGPRATWAAAP